MTKRWLRSADASNAACACTVGNGGILESFSTGKQFYCCPAFNLSLDSIFFSIAYSMRSPEGMKATADCGDEDMWVLAVYDGNGDFDAAMDQGGTVYRGGKVSISIRSLGSPMAGTGYDRVSGMLVDADGTVAAYGKIGDVGDDKAVFEIPEGISSGRYTLKVFAENVFGGKITRYASREKDFELFLSEKKEMPLFDADTVMEVDNTVKKLADVSGLPEGWKWDDDSDHPLAQGENEVVYAVYCGGDAEDYDVTQIGIQIYRKPCVEGEEVRFTGADDLVPTCTEPGHGHTECVLCGEVVNADVEVGAVEHEWEDDYMVDKPATCTDEGLQSIHCAVCGAKKDICPIGKKEHISSLPVKENESAPGDGKAASYDEVVYCASCGLELGRTHVEISPPEQEMENDTAGPNQTDETGSMTHDNDNEETAREEQEKSVETPTPSPAVSILPSSIPASGGNRPSGDMGLNQGSAVDGSKGTPSPFPTASESHNTGGSNFGPASVSKSQNSPGVKENPSEVKTEEYGLDLGNDGKIAGQQAVLTEPPLPSTEPAMPDPSGENNASDAPNPSTGNNISDAPDPTEVPQGATAAPEENKVTDAIHQEANIQENGDGNVLADGKSGGDGEKIIHTSHKKGDCLSDRKNGCSYKVVSVGKKKAAVKYLKLLSDRKKVSIPSTVVLEGVSYRVTGIAERAFKNNKKLKKIVIGKNIQTIGKQAFQGCRNLGYVRIKSKKLKNIGKQAFQGTGKNLHLRLPSKKVKMYKRMIRKAGGRV